MFILKKGHQPGVYVPLRALFLVIFCGCAARSVSDLVKNLEDRFFLDAAHFDPAHEVVVLSI